MLRTHDGPAENRMTAVKKYVKAQSWALWESVKHKEGLITGRGSQWAANSFLFPIVVE